MGGVDILDFDLDRIRTYTNRTLIGIPSLCRIEQM